MNEKLPPKIADALAGLAKAGESEDSNAATQMLRLINEIEALNRLVTTKISSPDFIEQVATSVYTRLIKSEALEPLIRRIMTELLAHQNTPKPENKADYLVVEIVKNVPEEIDPLEFPAKMMRYMSDHPTKPGEFEIYLRTDKMKDGTEDSIWEENPAVCAIVKGQLEYQFDAMDLRAGRLYYCKFYNASHQPKIEPVPAEEAPVATDETAVETAGDVETAAVERDDPLTEVVAEAAAEVVAQSFSPELETTHVGAENTHDIP